MHIKTYDSPLGKIVMAGDGDNLTGLWFIDQKYFGGNQIEAGEIKDGDEYIEVFQKTTKWLDDYFSGKVCNSREIPIKLEGTDFQKSVWNLLLDIPYGETTTYGKLASIIEKKSLKRVSAQGVGGAVSKNPISIIVPCHRVIGSDGELKGYAGGIERKKRLLEIETFSK